MLSQSSQPGIWHPGIRRSRGRSRQSWHSLAPAVVKGGRERGRKRYEVFSRKGTWQTGKNFHRQQ